MGRRGDGGLLVLTGMGEEECAGDGFGAGRFGRGVSGSCPLVVGARLLCRCALAAPRSSTAAGIWGDAAHLQEHLQLARDRAGPGLCAMGSGEDGGGVTVTVVVSDSRGREMGRARAPKREMGRARPRQRVHDERTSVGVPTTITGDGDVRPMARRRSARSCASQPSKRERARGQKRQRRGGTKRGGGRCGLIKREGGVGFCAGEVGGRETEIEREGATGDCGGAACAVAAPALVPHARRLPCGSGGARARAVSVGAEPPDLSHERVVGRALGGP